MFYSSPQSGYSLIEVLVAISILLIATVGPMTIASRSLQYAEFSSQQNTAHFLAQEGIEAVMMVREEFGIDEIRNSGDSWGWVGAGSGSQLEDCFVSVNPNGCGIDWRNVNNLVRVNDCGTSGDQCRIYFSNSTGRARYSHSSAGGSTPYTRTIYLDDSLPGDQVQVRSVVRWNMHPSGQPQQVVLETYVHDIYDFIP